MPFVTTAKVRFAHADAAGIVFYPRYFEMLNGAVEDWFEQDIGLDFKTLHLDRNLGLPTVRLEATFVAPSLLGDVLTIKITPREVGRSSCRVSIVFSCNETDRLRAEVVLVCMDLMDKRAVAWSDAVRARLEADLPAA